MSEKPDILTVAREALAHTDHWPDYAVDDDVAVALRTGK